MKTANSASAGSASAYVEVGLGGSSGGNWGTFYPMSSSLNPGSTNKFAGQSADSTTLELTSNPFQVRLNEPMRVALDLQINTLAAGGAVSLMESSVLLTVEDVFNVPSGVTVNSRTMGVTDNSSVPGGDRDGDVDAGEDRDAGASTGADAGSRDDGGEADSGSCRAVPGSPSGWPLVSLLILGFFFRQAIRRACAYNDTSRPSSARCKHRPAANGANSARATRPIERSARSS